LLIQRHQYPSETVRQGLRQVVQFRLDKTVADVRTVVRSVPVASMPHFPHLASQREHNRNAALLRLVPADRISQSFGGHRRPKGPFRFHQLLLVPNDGEERLGRHSCFPANAVHALQKRLATDWSEPWRETFAAGEAF
jgi:hypothetical protein